MTDFTFSSSSASEAENCPLGVGWCGWTLYSIANGRHFTPHERPAILRARRRRTRWRPVNAVPVPWVLGLGETTRLADNQGLLRERRHLHAWIAVGQRTLHLDWVCGTGGGPGFSYSLVRIHLDDRLVDEQAHGGSSLGFTVWGDMALAPVRRHLAIGVEPRRFSDAEPPTVWLMAPEGPRPAARTGDGRGNPSESRGAGT